MADKKKLHPNHLRDLRGSGLSDDAIAACGFYSEAEYVKLTQLLGRRLAKRCAPALVFPFRGPNGSNGYCRIKPDNPRKLKGKPVKYESPSGRKNEVFVPPGTFAAIEDPAATLLITEGEKKSAKADQEGFPCLGLVGVFGWKDGRAERMLSLLSTMEWKRRPVFLVFDSDITDNPNIQDAEARLAAQLLNHGARVRCVRLPDGDNDAKVGLDDYLVSHGPDAMQALLKDATEPDPVDAGAAKVPANTLDPATEAKEILARCEQDGVSRLQYYRGTFYGWVKGAYRLRDVEHVRGEIIRCVNQYAHGLTGSIVSNIVDQIKAQAGLWDVETPAWLGKPGPWPADEVLVARNGIFHLPSIIAGKESSIKPTPRLFTMAAVEYDVALDADKPVEWFRFLNALWPDDPQSIAALQEWFGYLLTADTSQQKILFLVGPKRSGKGTVARIIRGLVGTESVAGPTLATLGSHFGLWPLLGKSVAIIPDARLSGRSDRAMVIERLLSVSGEDALTIDRKHLGFVTTKLPTRLILVSNELPRLADASGALASRMVVLRLSQSWYGKEDTGLTDKLLGELPGILLWGIGGWARLQQRGHFVQPESAGDLVHEMYELASPASAFVEACCDLSPEAQVSRADLFNAYLEWCKDRGRNHPEDQAGFGRNLRAAFPLLGDCQPRLNGKKVRCYAGIRLKTEF